MIDSNFLEKIREETDIISIVSQYVPLRRSGKNYVGLCPFHQEKTPSFTVSPERNMFYCFGCHAGGDVITFLMKIENISFAEAVELLAKKMGLSVPLKSGSASEAKKETFWRLNETACSYFERMLYEKEGIKAREYLKGRGLKEEIWHEFRLGYAPSSEGLLVHLLNANFQEEAILTAGLISETKHELFRHRLTFPIADVRGKVIAFGGRALDESLPKYLNTPDSPIFSKGNCLYGLNLAKKAISERGTAIIVEGYMDVLSCHQFGFQNAVASLGTSLTINQVRLLSRFAKKIILSYDTDVAGVMATMRSLELFKSAQMEVRVVDLRGFKDPDELLQKKGGEFFSLLLQASIPATEFVYEKIFSQFDWKIEEERRRAVMELLSFISSLDSFLDQEKFIKRLSLDSGIAEDTLFAQLKKLSKSSPKQTRVKGSVTLDETEGLKSRPPVVEFTLLQLLLHEPEIILELEKDLDAEDFSNPALKKIFLGILEKWQKGEPNLYNLPLEDEEEINLLSRLALTPLATEEPLAEARQCLLRLKKNRFFREYKVLEAELKKLEGEKKSEEYRKKLQEMQKIANKIQSLNVITK